VNRTFRENFVLEYVLVNLKENEKSEEEYGPSLTPPEPENGDLVNLKSLYDALPREARPPIVERANIHQKGLQIEIKYFVEKLKLDQKEKGAECKEKGSRWLSVLSDCFFKKKNPYQLVKQDEPNSKKEQ